MSKSVHTRNGREVREARQQIARDHSNELAAPPKQQLAALDKRLGTGVGAKKERARLAAKMEKR